MERSRPSFDEAQIDDEIPHGSETLTDLASRVLFGNSLDQKLKLTRLKSITYDTPQRPGPLQGVLPVRPADLQFASGSDPRPSFPRTPAMIHEESRGVLLHFFANHELLAAELMALALLKFPDAPRAFREGLANTLREEQLHTRWYVNRMNQCGVTFGQYPLNRFFWDAVSTMDCPLDYVSRLSLTFEQANLDYARYFAGVLDEAGDKTSASILNRIYIDEISHVGYGLHWFRQWKDPEDSDWEALKKRLVFPLSASRAKGNRTPFNTEARSEAGFGDDYIQELALFERSKGRTPNIYYFNPEAENRIARHPAPFHPNKRIRSVIEDLEIVSAFLARRDDVVLLRKPPSSKHQARLAWAGIPLPEMECLTEDGHIGSTSLLPERKINQLCPWSRSPELPRLFSPLKNRPSETSPWKESDRDLFSKACQVEALEEWMGPAFRVASGDELEAAAMKLNAEGWEQLLIKRPYSTAGGGMKRLSLSEAAAYRGVSMSDEITTEGGLLLEPAHNRVLDFSVQYLVESDKIRQIGIIEQIIAPSGQYHGSLSFPKFCSGMEPELARFVMEQALPAYQPDSPFPVALLDWAQRFGFEGPLGVDAYLYRHPNGELLHRIACEINPRFTMGRVALDLRRHIAPGHGVKLEILKAEDLAKNPQPPNLQDGKISAGSLVLNEIHPRSRFAAQITVAKQQSFL